MLSPLPRHSDWGVLRSFPRRISLPRKGGRVGLCIDLFEVCSAFTQVTACTLAGSPYVTRCIGGFIQFVTSLTAPIASGRSDLAGWGLHPLEKRRLITAHTPSRRPSSHRAAARKEESGLLRTFRVDGVRNSRPLNAEVRLRRKLPPSSPQTLSSLFSSFRKRQSVPSTMIFCGVDLIMPTSCRRSA